MPTIGRINRKDFPIPGRLNIAIAIVSMVTTGALLYWTDNQTSWLFVIGVLAFSFINNTNFSLLHEATHGQFHQNRSINWLFGCLAAAFFPTSFTMQQLYHLGHHRRNRTDAEMFDLYYPTDSLIVKRLIIYGTVGGIYWMTPFLSCLLFLFNPRLVLNPKFKDSKFMSALSADHMLGGLESTLARVSRVRAEILFTICFQIALVYFLDVSWITWLACYWAFGVNWGSLQYADHVGARRNIREGAWNLKVNPLVRWIFLNYHLHLVHHRYPNLPWVHLPRLVDRAEPMPTYLSKLWEFVSGPRPATEPCPKFDSALDGMLFEGTPLEGAHLTANSRELSRPEPPRESAPPSKRLSSVD